MVVIGVFLMVSFAYLRYKNSLFFTALKFPRSWVGRPLFQQNEEEELSERNQSKQSEE